MFVEKKDLIKGLLGFPIEVVNLLVEECKRQNFVNIIPTFQNNTATNAMLTLVNLGFEFEKTADGLIFWSNVLIHKNFDLFFKFYPKKIMNKKVYIYQDGTVDPNSIIKTLESYGAVNGQNFKGKRPDVYYYIDPDNKIAVIDAKYIATVNLIKDNYTEIKALNEKQTVKISKKFLMKILNLAGNTEDYNFEFND